MRLIYYIRLLYIFLFKTQKHFTYYIHTYIFTYSTYYMCTSVCENSNTCGTVDDLCIDV